MARLAVVIPAATDRYKASGGVEGECREVVRRHLKDDAFSATHSCLEAYGLKQRRSDPCSPPLGQDAERQDLAFLVQVEGQGKPGRYLAFPGDSAEKSGDAHYLG